MDDVDVNLFRFDYDNTLYQFFMNSNGHIYTRYGMRKDGKSEESMTLAGIKDAMRAALEIHKKESTKVPPAWKPVETQDLLSFKKDPRRPGGCLHCHHAGFYVRREEYAIGKLTKETVWGFPYPQNVGIELDLEKNSIVKSVTDPATKAGLLEGDKILTVDGQRVITPGDFNHILNGFKTGNLKVGYERDGKKATASIELKGFEWRKTDITWRDSWWDNGANMGIVGEDLTPDEKKQMKIAADDLAFKIVRLFPKGSAQPAGLQVDDIITGVDGKSDAMGEIEFQMHMRLAHRIGDMVPIVYYRKGQKMTMQVKIK